MNNLYDALCDAEEGLSGFITLSGGHLFPVEENVVAGGASWCVRLRRTCGKYSQML